MRSREQVIWEFVQDWLRKANQDLETSLFLLQKEWEDYFNCAFHAQQAAEKFIKSYLVRHQVEFRKTHDLAELLNLVKKKDQALGSELAFCVWLTDFAVEFRYPGESPVTKELAEKALTDAHRVKEIILNSLKDYLSEGCQK